MSEFKLYTDEQLEKIERLRAEANKPKLKAFECLKDDNEWSPYRKLKPTDRVTIVSDGTTFIGYILSGTEEDGFTYQRHMVS